MHTLAGRAKAGGCFETSEKEIVMAKEVKCITKRQHDNPHRRVQSIGGIDNGAPWRRAEDDAILDVELDKKSYYVGVNGKSVWVIVATHNGRKYLKTETDGYAPNNLLSLPDCP
jgi:hypothetical protein